MGVSLTSYEIARSGLTVNERGLFVTSHNIANINTTGYVRQQAIIQNGPYGTVLTRTGLVQLGLGADIQQIRQIRNIFLDNIYRQENTLLGYWETRQKTFRDIEAILSEPMSTGLQSILNNFWDAWHELSKDPDSLTVRALVRQRCEALVQHINHLGEQLDRLQEDLNNEIVVRVDEINNIARQIAELNVAIFKAEANGDSANDYRDQRNLLIDRLTKLVNVDVTEMQDGQVDITISGYYIVQKGRSFELYTTERSAGGRFYVVKLVDGDVTVPIKSGILKGLLESRGEVSGAIGSFENGTPNTKTDVVFLVDESTISKDELENQINAYIAELQKRGLDCNVTVRAVASADLFRTEVASASADLRADANKYAIFVTNSTSLSDAELSELQAELALVGMDASVITDNPNAWSELAVKSDGKVYSLAEFADSNQAVYEAVARSIAYDTNLDVTSNYSIIPDSTDIVSDLKKRLNALINAMLREINYIHRSGMTMKDPPTQGEDLFITINPGRPLEMGNIMLNPNLSDLSNIAASRTGDAGDNSIALEIANLRNKELLFDSRGFVSLDDFYQNIILYVGNKGSEAVSIYESQTKLVESADSYRTSITGVSLDEEMANMLKFKFAYDAASRVLNIIDDMIETVITRMGLVGR